MKWPEELMELRAAHRREGVDLADLSPDPFVQFEHWLEGARAAMPDEFNAMVLSTVDPDGQPWARNVLFKLVDDGAFVFFTNYESRKALAIAHEPRVSLLFDWVLVGRQLTVSGRAEVLDDAGSDEYWATRPRGSQLGAWASPQSDPVVDRSELDRRFADVEARFQGREVPRPPHWGGYRVVPDEVQLWQGRDDRLHDRFRYTREGGGWRIARLAP